MDKTISFKNVIILITVFMFGGLLTHAAIVLHEHVKAKLLAANKGDPNKAPKSNAATNSYQQMPSQNLNMQQQQNLSGVQVAAVKDYGG